MKKTKSKHHSTSKLKKPPNEMEEDCSGWLWKKNGLFIGWKYRFFSLHGALLKFYDKFPAEEYLGTAIHNSNPTENLGFTPIKGETPPCGVLRVAHVEPGTNSNIAFKIYGISGMVVDVRADTPKTAKRWIEALIIASRLSRRKESCVGSMVSVSNDSWGTVESLSEEELSCMSNFVEKCGWLRKYDRGSWNYKFFVLQGHMLANYNNDKPWTVPNGRAYITGVTKSIRSSTGMMIHLSVGKKTMVHAETKEERNQWYEALKAAAL